MAQLYTYTSTQQVETLHKVSSIVDISIPIYNEQNVGHTRIGALCVHHSESVHVMREAVFVDLYSLSFVLAPPEVCSKPATEASI